MYQCYRAAALAAVMFTSSAASAQEAVVPTLSGGASQVTEVFGDWQVICGAVAELRNCVLSQEQLLDDGRRLILVNLAPGSSGDYAVSMIVPFGLLIAEGLTASVDQKPLNASALKFHSCQPVGCLVEASFGSADLQALRAGKEWSLSGVADDGQNYVFQLSLAGLTAAMDRGVALRQ